jgi:hypothetical protein
LEKKLRWVGTQYTIIYLSQSTVNDERRSKAWADFSSGKIHPAHSLNLCDSAKREEQLNEVLPERPLL